MDGTNRKVGIGPTGKGLLVLLAVGACAGIYFGFFHKGDTPDKDKAAQTAVVDKDGKAAPVATKGSNAVAPNGQPVPVAANVPVQQAATGVTSPCGGPGQRTCKAGIVQFPGHAPIIVANGGLKQQPGSYASRVPSIYGNAAGLNIELVFMDDPVERNTAFTEGRIDFMWQTVDELPINAPQYAASGPFGVMGQMDYTKGADGCVCIAEIQRAEDMPGHTSAMMKFCPDHSVFEAWITNSTNGPKQIAQIRRNISFSLDNPEYGRIQFCQGAVDCACVWEPDITKALACRKGAHTVMTTDQMRTFIADTLVSRVSFLEANPDVAAKMIMILDEGSRIASADVNGTAQLLFNVSPKMQEMGAWQAILPLIKTVHWASLGDMAAFFGIDGSTAKFDSIYKQADEIWSQYVEDNGQPTVTARYNAATLRWSKAVKAVYDYQSGQRRQVAASTGQAFQPIEAAQVASYNPALTMKAKAVMTKPVTINFATNSAVLDPTSRGVLKNEVYRLLDITDGMAVRLEGNSDATGNAGYNRKLSKQRAESVKAYLVQQGINPTRMVTSGNGPDNPVCTEKTPDCNDANRRTDIVFVNAN